MAEQYLDAHANSKQEWPKKPIFKGQDTGARKFERNGRGDKESKIRNRKRLL